MPSPVTHILILLSLTSVVKLRSTDINMVFNGGQKELLDRRLAQEGRSIQDNNWNDEDIDKKIKEEIEKSKKEIMLDVDEKISDALKERSLSDVDKEWIDSWIEKETERLKEDIRKNHEEIQSTIDKEVSGAKERIVQIQKDITHLDKQWKQELSHETKFLKMTLEHDLDSKLKSLEDKQVQDKDLVELQEKVQNTRNELEKISSDLTDETDRKITQVKEEIEEQISQSVKDVKNNQNAAELETELETRIQRVLEEKLKSFQENATPASTKIQDTEDSLLVWKIILGSLLSLNLLFVGYFFFIYRQIRSLKQELKESNGLRNEERPRRKFINNDIQVSYNKRYDETSISHKKMLI